jgi:hypothetical protein
MTKKVIGFIAVFISLVMVVPLSAKGPAVGKKGQSLGTLTDEEIHHITYMREEEKLARDVYLTLSEKYQAPIFENISESEQRHMDALERLIEKYGLVDPVEDYTRGVFPDPDTDTDTDFNGLYIEFVGEGEIDYCDALQVGIDIELLDIKDIDNALAEVVAKDVIRVLTNLLNGSWNHYSAFLSRYEAAGCQ